MWRRSLTLAAVFATVAACGSGSSPSSTQISTAKYDRACTTITDCVFAYDGPAACCGAGCANSVIAAHALGQYTSDLKNAEAAACSGTSGICSGAPGSKGGDPATVPTCSGAGRLDCVAGQCVFDAPDASTTD